MKKITKFFVLFLLGIISIGALTSCKNKGGGGDDDNNNNNNSDEPKVEITPDEDHPL